MTTKQAMEIAALSERDQRLLASFGDDPAAELAQIWIERAFALVGQLEMLEEQVARLEEELRQERER